MAAGSCSEHISDPKKPNGKFMNSTPPFWDLSRESWDARSEPLPVSSVEFIHHKLPVCRLSILDLKYIGIKDEAARMKATPPLAVAPLAHGDDMRWNPNDDGINFNP